MGYKHFVFTLLAFALIFITTTVLGDLLSEEVDQLCDVPGSFLYKSLIGEELWACGNLTDVVVNVTINEITELVTNTTVHWGPYHFDLFDSLNETRNPFDQCLNSTCNATFGNVTIPEAGNFTAGNFIINQNSTTVRILGGGKDICIGNCS